MNGKAFFVATLLILVAGCNSDTAPPVVADNPLVPPVDTVPVRTCTLGTPSTTTDIDLLPGGIWAGDILDCITQESVGAVIWVTEDGRFRIHRADGAFLRGTLQVDGDTFVSAGEVFLPHTPQSDTGTFGIISGGGTIAERQILKGWWTSGFSGEGDFEADYIADAYERESSLAMLAGVRYTTTAVRAADGVWYSTSGTWLVEPDGRFNGQDDGGCQHSGFFALIDSRYDIYEVQIEVSGCASAGLFEGLASHQWDAWGMTYLRVSADDGVSRSLAIGAYSQ